MLQQHVNTSRLSLLNKPRLVSARLLPVDVPLTPTSLKSFSFLWLYKGQTRRQRATSSYEATRRKKHRTTAQRSLHLLFFFQILFWDVFLEKQASRVVFFTRCSWWSFCVCFGRCHLCFRKCTSEVMWQVYQPELFTCSPWTCLKSMLCVKYHHCMSADCSPVFLLLSL